MHRDREKVYMYGKHALIEALIAAPHIVKKVFLSREAMQDKEIRHLLQKNNIPAAPLKGGEERKVGEDTAHQGVIALTDTSRLLLDFNDFVDGLQVNENTLLVLLHELTDPHNVGAIIRSAAAFGASGVLLPSHRQAPITGAVIKSSVGMVFRVPLVAIGNINHAVEVLQKKGFRAYALAMDGKTNVANENFEGPSLMIVGNEGEGIRAKTLERADVTLRIPMHERTESLNASVSAAIVMYEWSRKHKTHG